MNSSLANWDGSLSPQRAVAPSPTPLPAQNSNSSSNNGSPQLASTSQLLGLDIVKNSSVFETRTLFDAPQHRGVGGGSNEQADSHLNTNSNNQALLDTVLSAGSLQTNPEKSSSRNQSVKSPIPSLRYSSMSRSAPSLLNDNALFRQASFAPSPPHSLPSSSPSSFGSQGVATASTSLPSFGAPGPALSAPLTKPSFPTNASWLQTPNKGTPNPSVNSSPLSSLGSSPLLQSWWTGANTYAGQDSVPRDLPQQRKVKRAKKTGNASGSDKQQLFDSLVPSSPPPPADARALFTPSPPPGDAPLFTPPPLSPTQIRRPPPPPGVGVARRVVRDSDVPSRRPTQRPRRKTRVYVAVPPAPYAIKRARTSKAGQRGRERQQLPEKEKRGRSRSSDVETRSWRSGSRKGRRSRDDDDEEEEDSWSEGRMSKNASRGTSKRLMKGHDKNVAEVHSSIGDALNNAWANNEARGTYTVWRASGSGRGNEDTGRGSSGHGKQKRRGEEREEREEEDEEYGARKRAKGEKTRKLVWHPVDVREQPREREGSTVKRRQQPSGEAAGSSSSAVPVRRTSAWCEEFEEDGQRKTRLCFDVDTAEADRVACEALVRGGYFGLLALAGGEVGSGGEVRKRQQRRPCVVWPVRSQSEVGVSAGAPVVWRYKEEEEAERQAPQEGLKKSRRKVSTSGPEQVARGHSMQQLSAVPPALASQSTSGGPSNPHNTSSAPPLSPLLYIDFSKLNPKPEQRTKSGKPRALPAPSISRLLTPTQDSGASSNVERLSREGTTTADSELGSNGTDAEPEEADEQPMPLSEKAKGKQKVVDMDVDMDVDGRGTPSPEPMSAWINDSGSRGQRSASRERVARSSPILDISPFYNNNNAPQESPPKLHDLLSLPLHVSELPHLRGSYPNFENDMPYGDGTIDPSLLGGMDGDGQMMNGVDEPDSQYIHSPVQGEVPEGGSSSSQSSQSSSSSIFPTSPKIPPPPVLAAAADSSSELRTSQRRPAQRRMPDYLVSSEFPDLADDSASSSSSVYADESIPAPKAKAKAGTKSKQTAVAVKRRGVNGGGGGGTKVTDVAIPVAYDADRFFRYSGPPWPPGDLEAICHQCRNKTKLLSVKFEECAHAYCVRCIMVKYKANTVPFASGISSECCPRCNGTCSCDNCTSRRGEVYQFGRYYRPQVPTEKIKTGPRALGTARPRPTPYKILENLVIAPTTYNAILYDLSGAPMARTYHGADGNKDVLVAQPIKKQPRVFVGAVQEAWELGPDPIVYVEPPPAPIQKRKQGHRARTSFYVGDPSVLSLPVRTPSTNARQCDVRNERRSTTARTIASLMPEAGPSSSAVPPVSVQDEMDVDDVPTATSATALIFSSSSDQLAAVDALTAATTILSTDGSGLVDPSITASPTEDNDIHGLVLPEGQARRSLAGSSSCRSSAGTEAAVTPPPAPASNGTTSRSLDPFGSPLTSVANSDDIADQGDAGESSPSATTTAAEEDGEQESQKIAMGLSLEFGPTAAVFLPPGTSAVARGDEVQSPLLSMEVPDGAASLQALDEAQDPTFLGDSEWGGPAEPADCLATSTDTAREEAVTQSLQMVGMRDAEDSAGASQNPATFMGTADDTVSLKSSQPNGVASCDMGVVSADPVPLTDDQIALAISLGLQALGAEVS
ncbi:hypothetical protein R3P38DRAFT_2861120 [Favolaschia claudopus]|uniref:RING-type domain-containing protein n=1 Tax=Favolaschia claudopus TaxID=2862362 RepID=A0AAW0DNV0_9AGAR